MPLETILKQNRHASARVQNRIPTILDPDFPADTDTVTVTMR